MNLNHHSNRLLLLFLIKVDLIIIVFKISLDNNTNNLLLMFYCIEYFLICKNATAARYYTGIYFKIFTRTGFHLQNKYNGRYSYVNLENKSSMPDKLID